MRVLAAALEAELGDSFVQAAADHRDDASEVFQSCHALSDALEAVLSTPAAVHPDFVKLANDVVAALEEFTQDLLLPLHLAAQRRVEIEAAGQIRHAGRRARHLAQRGQDLLAAVERLWGQEFADPISAADFDA
ncbi:MAG: hypothetical protein R3F56_03605 [Planctomycetota bacterium]